MWRALGVDSRAAIRHEARRRRPQLAIGCVVAGLSLAQAGWPAELTAAGAAAGAAGWIFGRRAVGVAAVLILGATLAGALRIEALDRPARAAPPGALIDAAATLLDHPRAGLHGSSAAMKIESGPAKGLRILARRAEVVWPAVEPGTRFHLRGFVKPERAAGAGAPAAAFGSATQTSEANAGTPGTPGFGPLPASADPAGAFDFGAFLRSRGIGREVQVETLVRIGRRGGIAGAVDAMRIRAEAAIGTGLPPELAALARGMVLGDDSDITDSTRDDFRRSGLAHLLAASGQNVALLCALALPLLMLIGAPQRARTAVLLPLVVVYVALAGSGASVVRAGIMAVAALVALAAGRRASAVYALLLAAAVTLALNPRATADPGWQLSFAAVIGMLTLGPLVRRRLRRLPRAAAEAIGATAAATLATSPLLAHDFGAVSLAALPANLVAFPAVAPIMWIGMAEAALEQLGLLGVPFAAAAHAVEATLAPLARLALGWVAGTATRFADPSWAQSSVHLSWLGVAAAYGLLGAAATMLTRRPIRMRLSAAAADLLDRARALSPSARRAYAAPLVALALAAGVRASAAPAPPRNLTIDFIDVGQGDSTLIRDPTGAAVLFDGGVPEARVDRTLRRLGVRRLSVVVATHQSRDHHAGLVQVVRRFPVGLFLDGRYGVPDASFTQLEHEVDGRRIPRRTPQRGERLRVGTMTIDILWPPPRGSEPPPADPNTRATVAIVSAGGFRLFLSADAESAVDLALPLPRVSAMKVPHHGSADPGLPRLLDRLRPAVAAIETGRGNPYGHPRPSTLAALRAKVPRVYRTDRDGTIELTVSGGRIAIRRHR